MNNKLYKSRSLLKLLEVRHKLTLEHKQKILKILKESSGNPGGETDITYADNLNVCENEFTGTGNPSSTEPNVIAKVFVTGAGFDSYIRQRRGIQFTAKEIQSIYNYKKFRPTKIDNFHVKYDITDPFGNNNTTIIKKLKESGGFCWTAFSKFESANQKDSQELDEPDKEKEEGEEDELKEQSLQQPMPQSVTPPQPAPTQPAPTPPATQATPEPLKNSPSNQDDDDETEEDEITVSDTIRISKSIIFNNETEGANILSRFLKALNL